MNWRYVDADLETFNECGQEIVQNSPGVISSKNYPEIYDNGLQCEWLIGNRDENKWIALRFHGKFNIPHGNSLSVKTLDNGDSADWRDWTWNEIQTYETPAPRIRQPLDPKNQTLFMSEAKIFPYNTLKLSFITGTTHFNSFNGEGFNVTWEFIDPIQNYFNNKIDIYENDLNYRFNSNATDIKNACDQQYINFEPGMIVSPGYPELFEIGGPSCYYVLGNSSVPANSKIWIKWHDFAAHNVLIWEGLPDSYSLDNQNADKTLVGTTEASDNWEDYAWNPDHNFAFSKYFPYFYSSEDPMYKFNEVPPNIAQWENFIKSADS